MAMGFGWNFYVSLPESGAEQDRRVLFFSTDDRDGDFAEEGRHAIETIKALPGVSIGAPPSSQAWRLQQEKMSPDYLWEYQLFSARVRDVRETLLELARKQGALEADLETLQALNPDDVLAISAKFWAD